MPNLLRYELNLISSGTELIAGVDEVGRGALAGPMVVAAAIVNPEHLRNYDVLSEELELLKMVNDSKLVSPKKRQLLSDFLIKTLFAYAIVEIPNTQIDSKGLAACTQFGFYNSIQKLHTKPDHILTDAFEIRAIAKAKQTNIISGDKQSISIAAASIIAKVYRDNLMCELHTNSEKYKVYGFDKHKGYGTKMHIESMRTHGLSDVHRKSFIVAAP